MAVRFTGSIGLWKGPRLFGAALACALMAFGCGSGGGEGSISKSEFIRRASEICRAADGRIQAKFAAYGRSSERRKIERAERAGELTFEEASARVAEGILIPVMRQESEELRGLGIPEEGEGRTKALLKAFDEGIKAAEAHPQRAAHDGTEAFGKSSRLAEEYGLEGC
jgi:hypothetical protein